MTHLHTGTRSSVGASSLRPNFSRIAALDLLRGFIMLLMVVDHARDYANLPSVSDPMNIDQISPALFFTRWISHFCAPLFVLLAGVSARLAGAKMQSKAELTEYLRKRGAFLILLEFTLIWFAWTFNWHWKLFYMQVIWVLGVGMVVLSVLIHYSEKWIVAFGVILVVTHNLFDQITFHPNTPAHYFWSIIHQKNVLALPFGYSVRTTYPLIPLIGVIALGYGLGNLYQNFSPRLRQRSLLIMGSAGIASFLFLRSFNLYGEANDFIPQPDFLRSVMSFLNVTKYPTSLQFLLMTIGPALIFLAWIEAWEKYLYDWLQPLITFGRVPMFYYLAHLYLLHSLGICLALIAGYSWGEFNFEKKISGLPEGFHLPLWGVYALSLVTILLLYPACHRYAGWRRQSRSLLARYM